MSMIRVWIFILFSFLVSTVFGQGQHIKSDYYQNFIPKTPESTPLGSFGNTPINYYTGLPEVSLPLMTLKGIRLELPITLNYDPSGVRTDELSGPVGLKWSLSAGGYVARSLNGGWPDETPIKGFITKSKEANYFREASDYPALVRANEKKEFDTEPDEFVINIPGRSIKFVFDKYGVAMPIPRQAVRINKTITNGKITKFELITEDGTVYIFGENVNAIEERKIESLNLSFAIDFEYAGAICDSYFAEGIPFYKSGGEKYSNSVQHTVKTIDFFNSRWHLISIENTDGETITFNYSKTGTVTYATRPSLVRWQPMTRPYPTNISTCYPLNGGQYQVNGFSYQRGNDRFGPFEPVVALRSFPPTNPGSAPGPDNCPMLQRINKRVNGTFYALYDFEHYGSTFNVRQVTTRFGLEYKLKKKKKSSNAIGDSK